MGRKKVTRQDLPRLRHQTIIKIVPKGCGKMKLGCLETAGESGSRPTPPSKRLRHDKAPIITHECVATFMRAGLLVLIACAFLFGGVCERNQMHVPLHRVCFSLFVRDCDCLGSYL